MSSSSIRTSVPAAEATSESVRAASAMFIRSPGPRAKPLDALQSLPSASFSRKYTVALWEQVSSRNPRQPISSVMAVVPRVSALTSSI